MEMEIKADLPFGWCRNCTSRTLHEEKMVAGGEVYDTWTTCKNAPICEAAEKARTAGTAGSGTELRYPTCKGHQGCKTCEDNNRGFWACCPITPPEEWIEDPRAIGYTCRHCGKTLATRRHKITESAFFLRCPICNEVTVIRREEAGRNA